MMRLEKLVPGARDAHGWKKRAASTQCPRLAYFGGVARQTVSDNLNAGIHQGVLFTNRWSTGPMPTWRGMTALPSLPAASRRGGTGSRYTAVFFRNLGGPANKQPYAAVIAGTAAAQSPSIAADSIGSRSRSQQRTNWKIWTNGSRTLGQSAAILTEKSRANSAKSLANVSCHERGKKYLTWQNASNAEPPPGIDERHRPARGKPILVSAIYFAAR
jgi:hypothetical protein